MITTIVKSRWLNMALLLVAVLAGIDDALESWFGLVDLFHLDVHHGVIGLSVFHLMKSIDDMSQGFDEVKSKLRDGEP